MPKKTFTVTMEHAQDTRFLSDDHDMAQILKYCASAAANAHTTGPQPKVTVEFSEELPEIAKP